MENETKPVWSVIANIVPKRLYGPDGNEIKIGTKHFTPNTKVYVVDGYWGMGGESVTVIASPRKTTQYVVITIQASVLHNFRTKMIYKPQVLKLLSKDVYNIANDKMTEEHAKDIAISLSNYRWADTYYRRLKNHLEDKYSNDFIQQCKHCILYRFCEIYIKHREQGISETDSATQTVRLLLKEKAVDDVIVNTLINDVHSSLGLNESKQNP